MIGKGTKVLVTGADGFIGSHLAEALVARGADVTALALYNSFNSWGWLDTVPSASAMKIVTGDVRDAHFCLELTRGVDVVFHLAALIAIPFSYRAPASYVDTNINGTLNLCQAALANGVRRFVHTSTSEVYGTAQYVPIDERHPLQPQSPYSATKIGADSLALSFWHAFQLPVIVARPFNTYGPRQSARAVIPTIITQIASGVRQVELGDPTPTRDFTFVADTCSGFLHLADCVQGLGEVINIGTGSEISVGDLFQLIARLMDSPAELVHKDERLRPEGSEVRRLCCDPRKLLELTGWKPSTALLDGLQSTIAWFRNPANLMRYKTSVYNV